MPKPVALNEVRARAARFRLDWLDSPGDERQDAQSFVRDLLAVYGITETKAAFYEKRVRRTSTGRQGYIDALVPGLALIEMKSAGEDLAKAERQALDYIDGLPSAEVPRYVLVSDFRTFRLLDLHAPDGDDLIIFDLNSFPDNSDRLAFFAGYSTSTPTTAAQEAASVAAARLMAGLYEELEGSGYDDHEASIFLVRTLFCLYADDAGVWERDLFLHFLADRTAEDGSDLGAQLSYLFQVMARPVENRQSNLDELLARFPYVNGGIFEQPLSIPAFDTAMRTRLLDACLFNWSSISPAVFGSLFQAVKDKTARRDLGEHYTTETNILRVIRPLFLDELNERFSKSINEPRGLRRLRKDMGELQFLDPACGCGNFLVVAYREMRALDLRILTRLQELKEHENYARGMWFEEDELPVRLSNFHGIELEDWPARIAETALHLVDHQANQAMELALGAGPETLPLDKVDSIHVGNAIRMDWSTIVPASDNLRIMGNPPFIGMSYMSKEQQEDNRLAFSQVDVRGLRTGRLDYVACWYAKAMAFTKDTTGARIAYVSTNSITQGEQARTMVPLLARNGFAVDFGHQTFKWTSEAPGAAAVHCIIAGFSPTARKRRVPRLFTYPKITAEPVEQSVSRLNFYLTDGPDLVPARLRAPANVAMPFATQGSKPVDGGNLLLNEDDLESFTGDPVAAQYLRRFIQGRDMLQGSPRRWCLWLKHANPSDLRSSPMLRERLEAVRESREKSPTQAFRDYAERPGLFVQDRQPSGDYFALPEVSSETRRWIPGRFFDSQTIAGNKLIIFPDAEPWHAAFLQSSMFMAWVGTFAGRLESRYSISPALAYFPIPWPDLTQDQRDSLSEAWSEVETARSEFPDATLADLYAPNAMPPSLLDAHSALDALVDRAFGSSRKLLDNAARFALLLNEYEKSQTSNALKLPKARRSRR